MLEQIFEKFRPRKITLEQVDAAFKEKERITAQHLRGEITPEEYQIGLKGLLPLTRLDLRESARKLKI